MGAVERFSALNDHAVVRAFQGNTHRGEFVYHDNKTVRFFDFQLLRIPDHGCTVRCGGKNRDDRDFIDQGRDQFALDDSAGKRRRIAHEKVCNRFSAGVLLIQKCDVSTHGAADAEHTVAGRVDADIFQEHLRAWNYQRGGDEVGGGGNISRHTDEISMEIRVRKNRCGQPFGGNVGAEEFQHQLRMVSGKSRFGNACFSVSIQSGKQDTRFDLCGCDRRKIGDGVERMAVDRKRRAAVFRNTADGSAHLGQRIDDASHRPFLNGGVTGQCTGKVLAGKKASVSYGIGDKTETVNGSCSPKDFETMMQLTYLTFTAPRRDDDAFASYKNRNKAALQNMEMNPQVAFSDSVSAGIYMHHPRRARIKADMIDKMDYDKILSMYQDRYKDASDFTFIFVGNVNVEEMKPLIAEYLGSLPAINRNETFKDNKEDMRKGVYKNEFVRKQETAKASNFVLLNGDCKYDLKNDILLSMTSQILDLVYTAKVREDEGGTYGVYVGGQLSKYPKEKALLQIVFETAPAKREKLMQIIFAELDNIAKAGPSEGDLNKVKEFMLKKHAEDLKENSYWLGSIDEYLFTGMNPIKDYEQIVNSITVKDIQKFTDDLFKQKNEIEVSMISPETPDKE